MKKITLVILSLALILLDNELNAWWPPGVPSVQYPQQGVPYSGMPVPNQNAAMPYGFPQGVPYPYTGMQVPVPPPPPPQYPTIPPQYVPSFAEPYANDVGQKAYEAALPEYNNVASDVTNKANSYISSEETDLTSKAEAAKNSALNEVESDLTAKEQAISGKLAGTANSISSGAGDVVSKGATDAFSKAMSGFSGIMKGF